jgi:hypothetical protein
MWVQTAEIRLRNVIVSEEQVDRKRGVDEVQGLWIEE